MLGSSLSIHDQFPSVGAEKHLYRNLNINQAHILCTYGVGFHGYLPQNTKKPVILRVQTCVQPLNPSTLSFHPQPSTPRSLSLEQPPVPPKRRQTTHQVCHTEMEPRPRTGCTKNSRTRHQYHSTNPRLPQACYTQLPSSRPHEHLPSPPPT